MPKLQIDGQTIGEVSDETAAFLFSAVAGRRNDDLWQEKQFAEFQTRVESEMKPSPRRNTIADYFDLQLMRWTSIDAS